MNMPRLKEEGSLPVLDDVQRNDTFRAILAWVQDLLGEKPEPDTSIAWEDGEEHSEAARRGDHE
ncbi:MAG: hypothetical protein ABL879_00845 [Devosia sp.]